MSAGPSTPRSSVLKWITAAFRPRPMTPVQVAEPIADLRSSEIPRSRHRRTLAATQVRPPQPAALTERAIAAAQPVLQLTSRPSWRPGPQNSRRATGAPRGCRSRSRRAGPVRPTQPDAPEEPDVSRVPGRSPDDADPAAGATDAGNGRQRPRIEVVPPRAGRSRMLRNVFVGSVLALGDRPDRRRGLKLRDRPQTLPSSRTETADTQQSDIETKFGDRVGGDAVPAPKAAARPEGDIPSALPRRRRLTRHTRSPSAPN